MGKHSPLSSDASDLPISMPCKRYPNKPKSAKGKGKVTDYSHEMFIECITARDEIRYV